jgi:hypothetical protein
VIRGAWYVTLAVVCATPVRAWNDDAHKIVCEIATTLLDAKARTEVKALVRAIERPDGQRYAHLATACALPDTARAKAREHERTGADRLARWARFRKFDRWHFVNVPRDARHVPDECADCVLSAVAFHRARFADPALTLSERGEALAFLGHWVADVHQPLHVAYEDDRGGNSIDRLTGLYAESDNLHAVWDGAILSRAQGGRHWRTYAGALAAGIEDAERAAWERGDVQDWADESYAIVTEEAFRYCRWKKGQCRFLGRERFLGPDYQDRWAPVVERRLQQAAVRLAKMISAGLAGAPFRAD